MNQYDDLRIELRNHQQSFKREARARFGILNPTLTQVIMALIALMVWLVVHVGLGLRLSLTIEFFVYVAIPLTIMTFTSDIPLQGVTMQKWIELQVRNWIEPRRLVAGFVPPSEPSSANMTAVTYSKETS